jgi:hypothetical protein
MLVKKVEETLFLDEKISSMEDVAITLKLWELSKILFKDYSKSPSAL